MASTTVRRSITSSDPRSPLQLSTLTTSFPQHQLISSFQALQVSPFRFSPTTPFTRPAGQSPIFSRSTRLIPEVPKEENELPIVSFQGKRRRSSSLAKLIGPQNIPGLCACGQGRKSTKHILRNCPRFESEREQLVSQSPTARSPSARSPGSQIPRDVASQRKLLHVVKKWRMRTLLGKYQIAVQTQQKGETKKRAMKSLQRAVA
jgi:hypothetical protein